MRTRISAKTVVRILCACVVLAVLILACALPFVVSDDEYGDVHAPGAGTVHLPAGHADVALCSQELDAGAESVPPPSLSVRITSLDGGPDPEVTPFRREASGTRCDVVTQLAVVQIHREGDYRVTVDGEDVCCPYQPRVVFGDFVWNDGLLSLLTVDQITLAFVGILLFGLAIGLGVPAVLMVLIVVASNRLQRLCGKPGAGKADSSAPQDADLVRRSGLVDWPPEDLVLPYPDQVGRAVTFCSVVRYLLSFGLLVAFPVWATIWHLTVPGPIHWPAVVFLACWVVGFCVLFWRLTARWSLIRERRARGDGWLRLSAKGFELHQQWGKPRHHDWSDVDAFTLAESTDGEGTVSQHVRIHFADGHQRADVNIAGFWDCPVEQAVDLMDGWLQSYRVAKSDAVS